MKKTIKILFATLLIAAIAILCFSCGTTAIWQEKKNDTDGIQADTQEVNGSAKYIVYAALNASGNLITHPAEGDPEATAAYAVVGYTGLVPELVIPAQYNGKNVTKVLIASPYGDYYCYRDGAAYTGDDARLQDNTVVTSIVFGSNVLSVGAGVCTGMVHLQSVTFTASSAVVLGDAAFSACYALTSVTGSWSAASGATPFRASGYTPA